MNNVVLVVSTRDYPFNDNRDNYHIIKATALDDVINKLKLDDDTINAIVSQANGKEESIIRAAKRGLCWTNYEHSSWNGKDWYPDRMLLGPIPVFHFALEEDNKDSFFIYVGPCTNERLDNNAELRTLKSRAYTEGLIQSAINDFNERYKKKIDQLIALVHGPDIIASGSGQVAGENLSLTKNNYLDEPCRPVGNIYEKFKECLIIIRYQHDASDQFYSLIVGPIVTNNLTHDKCSLLLQNTSHLQLSSRLVKSYKTILDTTDKNAV